MSGEDEARTATAAGAEMVPFLSGDFFGDDCHAARGVFGGLAATRLVDLGERLEW